MNFEMEIGLSKLGSWDNFLTLHMKRLNHSALETFVVEKKS